MPTNRAIYNDDFRSILSQDQAKFGFPASEEEFAGLITRVGGTGITTFVLDAIEYDNKVYFATKRGADWAQIDFGKYAGYERWDKSYGAAARLIRSMRAAGREPLQVFIECCRNMGVEAIAGLRMNDCHSLEPLSHDSPDVSFHLKEHPEQVFRFPGTDEPTRLARAVADLQLRYVVITSVCRDDVPDRGASRFAETVNAVRALQSAPLVEVLIPDYTYAYLDFVLESRPHVLAHNIEVVDRLTKPMRDRRFQYRRSLGVLEQARARGAETLLTKSSIMLGLGETDEEVVSALTDLRKVDVNILVLGQYLQPTTRHAEVVEYVHPDRFDSLAERAREMGFGFVVSGPLVRTSYKAAEAYVAHQVGEQTE